MKIYQIWQRCLIATLHKISIDFVPGSQRQSNQHPRWKLHQNEKKIGQRLPDAPLDPPIGINDQIPLVEIWMHEANPLHRFFLKTEHDSREVVFTGSCNKHVTTWYIRSLIQINIFPWRPIKSLLVNIEQHEWLTCKPMELKYRFIKIQEVWH